jgi:hypothetical protein
MAVAGLLGSVFNLMAHPKKRSEVKVDKLELLNEKTANILFAIAEAVLGENFLLKAPKFIETVDDYLYYQRREINFPEFFETGIGGYFEGGIPHVKHGSCPCGEVNLRHHF